MIHSKPLHVGELALVTGGSRGIGRAIALALAANGWTVAICGRDRAALAATAALCESGRIKTFSCDLAVPSEIDALVGMSKVMAREGQDHGIRVHVICPGGVATDMVTQARPDLDPAGLIQPDDIADAVLYLAHAPATCVVDEIHLRRNGATPFA